MDNLNSCHPGQWLTGDCLRIVHWGHNEYGIGKCAIGYFNQNWEYEFTSKHQIQRIGKKVSYLYSEIHEIDKVQDTEQNREQKLTIKD